MYTGPKENESPAKDSNGSTTSQSQWLWRNELLVRDAGYPGERAQSWASGGREWCYVTPRCNGWSDSRANGFLEWGGPTYMRTLGISNLPQMHVSSRFICLKISILPVCSACTPDSSIPPGPASLLQPASCPICPVLLPCASGALQALLLLPQKSTVNWVPSGPLTNCSLLKPFFLLYLANS